MIPAVILKPIVNEKSMNSAKTGLYTFAVDKRANKRQIEKVIESKFNVEIVDIKTVIAKGKKKAQRTRKGYFRTPDVKKALVQLKEGQKIALFETMSKEVDEDVTVTTAEGENIEVKEKKSLLSNTKVKIEKTTNKKDNKKGDK